MYDLKRLDDYLVPFRVETGWAVFCGPCFDDIPPRLVIALFIDKYQGDVFPGFRGSGLRDLLVPVVKLHGISEPFFE